MSGYDGPEDDLRDDRAGYGGSPDERDRQAGPAADSAPTASIPVVPAEAAGDDGTPLYGRGPYAGPTDASGSWRREQDAAYLPPSVPPESYAPGWSQHAPYAPPVSGQGYAGVGDPYAAPPPAAYPGNGYPGADYAPPAYPGSGFAGSGYADPAYATTGHPGTGYPTAGYAEPGYPDVDYPEPSRAPAGYSSAYGTPPRAPGDGGESGALGGRPDAKPAGPSWSERGRSALAPGLARLQDLRADATPIPNLLAYLAGVLGLLNFGWGFLAWYVFGTSIPGTSLRVAGYSIYGGGTGAVVAASAAAGLYAAALAFERKVINAAPLALALGALLVVFGVMVRKDGLSSGRAGDGLTVGIGTGLVLALITSILQVSALGYAWFVSSSVAARAARAEDGPAAGGTGPAGATSSASYPVRALGTGRGDAPADGPPPAAAPVDFGEPVDLGDIGADPADPAARERWTDRAWAGGAEEGADGTDQPAGTVLSSADPPTAVRYDPDPQYAPPPRDTAPPGGDGRRSVAPDPGYPPVGSPEGRPR